MFTSRDYAGSLVNGEHKRCIRTTHLSRSKLRVVRANSNRNSWPPDCSLQSSDWPELHFCIHWRVNDSWESVRLVRDNSRDSAQFLEDLACQKKWLKSATLALYNDFLFYLQKFFLSRHKTVLLLLVLSFSYWNNIKYFLISPSHFFNTK